MKNGYSIDINIPGTLSRFSKKFEAAQVFLDNEVLKDSAPFTPRRDGYLEKSGVTGTKIGTGKVVYNIPYARRMYYGLDFNFSKDKHPQAGPQWFEVAKAIHKQKWIQGVNKIIRG